MKSKLPPPPVKVTNTGGFFGQGEATNIAIAQPGEARGHKLWADGVFVRQVYDAMNSAKAGTPSRWTHDDGPVGNTRSVGRFFRVKIDRDGVLRGTLHFQDSQWGHIAREWLAGYDTDTLGASATSHATRLRKLL